MSKKGTLKLPKGFREDDRITIVKGRSAEGVPRILVHYSGDMTAYGAFKMLDTVLATVRDDFEQISKG